MPTSHRTPAVLLVLPVLLAGGACAGLATAQVTFEFTNSGQALGSSQSNSVVLGDLDGDGDLDAMVGNYMQPNTVWTNDGTGTFTDSGQALGNSGSFSVALGDLDGDSDLDAMVANSGAPNRVWGVDGCPDDPNKTAPGFCGCGVVDTPGLGGCDLNGDGVYDDEDVLLAMTEFGIAEAGAPLGDLNGDGVYDANDIRVGMADFGITEAGACPADTNRDGSVDGQDLAAVLANWGLPCGP